jgi:threonylcarbamoyladenosine tRNA methylthiotransferase MtaB
MTTYWLENFGCRATQADTAAIERQLVGRGARRVSAAEADLVVVNTCTVTAAADAQAREAIRTLHARNPAARILATGCYAQRAPEELAALPGVEWVVGNSHQRQIGALAAGACGPSQAWKPQGPAAAAGAGSFISLDTLAAGGVGRIPFSRAPKILTGDIFEATEFVVPSAASAAGTLDDRTRPVLKIQDGCNQRCSYCVIPFVRGRSRSLPQAEVLHQVQQLVAVGAKEIVLSGINLGSWGRDLTPRVALRDLLARLLDETSLERLRLSSIEPMDLTLDLVELAARSSRLAPHFHAPLQSGSDHMLAAMHRWYRGAHYAERILRLAERLPGAAIGADVICGFPGETNADHCATVELIEKLPFAYLHVFSYSSRPGTQAAAFSSPVAQAVVRQRSRELRALSARKAAAFRASQAGTRQRVLTLGRGGTTASGIPWTGALTGNYLRARVTGTWPRNTWLDVRLELAPASEPSTELYARSVPV